MTSLAVQQPCVSRFAAYAIATNPVGKKNPIDLPLIPIEVVFGPTVGEQIGQGGFGGIYEVSDKPGRVYKIIFTKTFNGNGDEIRISEIAGKLGIGPAFHGACLVQQPKNQFIAIEMDYAGKTLSRWNKEFAEAAEPVVEEKPLTEEEIAMKEMIEKMNEECGFKVISCRENKTLPLEVILEKLGETPEAFYIELFSKIKRLAEERIAYMDTNWGNIVPKTKQNTFKLIDFDGAELMDSPEAAAVKAARGAYNYSHFRDFVKLPQLSPESRALIAWYRSKM